MNKLFLKLAILVFISNFVSAYENQGVVYDLKDYRHEIGIARPWAGFSDYMETLDNPTAGVVNSYVGSVSKFVVKRCPIEYCKHILIVGDDFIVPMERKERVYTGFGGYSQRSEVVFRDFAYTPGTLKNISDTNVIFSEVEPVTIVTPDNVAPELRDSIEELKKVLRQKNGIFIFQELKSTQVDCTPGPANLLNGKTIIAIGTQQNNNAMKCLDFYTGQENTISIHRNILGDHLLGGRKQIIAINTNDTRNIKFVAKMWEKGMFNNTDFDTIKFIDTQLDQCSWASLVPGTGIIDTIGDICQGLRDCGHFAGGAATFDIDAGKGGWCVVDGIAVLGVGVGVKYAKIVDKLKNAGENGIRFLTKYNTRGIELLANTWMKSETKLDEIIQLINKHGDEVGEFFLEKFSRHTDEVAKFANKLDDLKRTLSPSAKRVFNESEARMDGVNSDLPKLWEAVAYGNMEKKFGAELIKTEKTAGQGVDFIAKIGTDEYAVSVKTFMPGTTSKVNISDRILEKVLDVDKSPAKTKTNIIYVQAFESNYEVAKSAIESVLAGERGQIALVNSDEIKIVLSKVPNYLAGGG